MRWLLASMLTLLSIAPASAQTSNPLSMQLGRDALETCGNSDKSPDGFVCAAWINGAVQANAVARSVYSEAPEYCTPKLGGSVGEYRDVYVKFMRDNPAKEHLPAILLFYQAMSAAFPCTP